MKRLKSNDVLAIIFLALWHWFVFWQAALGQQVFAGGDISSFFYPVRLQLARALSEGRLPLWEPGMQAGFPLCAEGQVAALYPPNLLLYHFLPITLALSWTILIHLSWASVGMFLFARASGLCTTSATLAGFVFGSNGFILAHVEHMTLEAVLSWMPWLLLVQNRMQASLQNRNTRWIFWFLMVVSSVAFQFLAGFPQMAVISLIPFGIIGIFGPWMWNRSQNVIAHGQVIAISKSVGISILCAILGVGIAAVQLVPSYELLGMSVRGKELAKEFFFGYSMDWKHLTQLLLPFWFLGVPTGPNQEFWAFPGTSVLALAALALFIRRQSRVYFFFLLGMISLSLAFGETNPLYELLYYVPLFNRFRVPTRFLSLFALSVAYLAAATFDELKARLGGLQKDSLSLARLGTVLCVPIGLMLILREALPAEVWADAWLYLPWIFLICTVTLVALAFKHSLPSDQFASLTLGLVLVELTLFSFPFFASLASLASPDEVQRAPVALRAMDATLPFYRIMTNNSYALYSPNRPIVYGKQSAQIYSPLALQRHDDYVKDMSAAMLNLSNVRYIFYSPEGWQADGIAPPPISPFDIFQDQVEFPPIRTTRVEIVSFTKTTGAIKDGLVLGTVSLYLKDQQPVVLPIRLGADTAEWNYDVLAARNAVKHERPQSSLPFVTYTAETGEISSGLKFVAQYNLGSPMRVIGVSALSQLWSGELAIERVSLIDEAESFHSVATLAQRNDLALAYIGELARMFENRDVLPRAFIVHSAQIVSDDQVLARMQDPVFDPRRVVLLSEGESLEGTGEAESVESAEIVEYKSEHVAVWVNASRGGYLLLADSWYPGWDASVDGVRAPIYRADYIFRAVAIPPGAHSVVFEYRPASFALGAWMSAISGVVTMLLALGAWFRK